MCDLFAVCFVLSFVFVCCCGVSGILPSWLASPCCWVMAVACTVGGCLLNSAWAFVLVVAVLCSYSCFDLCMVIGCLLWCGIVGVLGSLTCFCFSCLLLSLGSLSCRIVASVVVILSVCAIFPFELCVGWMLFLPGMLRF